MAHPFLESHNMKKKPSKFFSFNSFAEPGYPMSFTGTFRDNIRRFLQECAEPETYNIEGMPVWRTFLVHESSGLVVPLYTVEENVKHCYTPFCDYCRCVGWSHHFLSKRKYHLIIPVDHEWNKPLDDVAFDLQTHLLHGLIHCNGFGHLICINGIEGGSKNLCGKVIMDLWDRICTALHTRKITVEDLSMKNKMELRILHGIAQGHSWFGCWGYRFFHGSFGVKEHNYETAIHILSSLELDQVIDDCSRTYQCRDIKQIIQQYRNLSEAELVTIRDLFKFMLTFRSRASTQNKSSISDRISQCSGRKSGNSLPVLLGPASSSTRSNQRSRYSARAKSTKCRKFSNVAASMDSRWPVRRLEQVADAVVAALKEKRAVNKAQNCGMTRQEARDAARLHIGDTGLIDHALKAMNNVVVGKYIVRREVNSSTRILEYTLQDIECDLLVDQEQVQEPVHKSPTTVPGVNVYSDMYHLYKKVVLSYPGSDVVNLAVQTIKDSKHFVKDWPFRDEEDDMLRFICRIMPSSADLKDVYSVNFPIEEYIVVPLFATIADLKSAIQNSMQDTYCAMEGMLVLDVIGTEGMNDDEVLFGILESGAELWTRCYWFNSETDFKYEGGAENWTVKCRCGAQDDDGERMLSCDVCENWQHTRCSGIGDADAVPRLFVCDACCMSLAPAQTHHWSEFGFEHQHALVLPDMYCA